MCYTLRHRQILSKMDGLVNLQNVLVVGMTNRKELLDEALLRPGRMEVMNNHSPSLCIANSHFYTFPVSSKSMHSRERALEGAVGLSWCVASFPALP